MPVEVPPGDASDPAFHRTVLDGLPEAVVVADGQGRITFVNAAVSDLLGYRPDEIIGAALTELVPRRPGRRADPVEWLARWAQAPDVEQFRFLDLTARRKDGGELPVEVRVRSGQVGGALRYFLSVRDNAARRREQLALKDANLRAARILMVAEDAIVSVDADQRIIVFNQAAERMFGYAAEDVLGKPLSILVPPSARARHAGEIESFRLAKQASRMMGERPEVQGQRRTGETFPLEATITKVMAAGSLTYTAHLRDVTERNRTRDALAERERRTRAVFDHASEPIALLDPDGSVLEINSAAAALTEAGAHPNGKAIWEVAWLGPSPAVAPGAADALRRAVTEAAGGRPSHFEATLEKDGTSIRLDVRLNPIPGDDGAVRYVLAEGRIRD